MVHLTWVTPIFFIYLEDFMIIQDENNLNSQPQIADFEDKIRN